MSRTRVASAGLALMLVMGGASAAAADPSTPAPSVTTADGTRPGPAAKRLCARADRVDARPGRPATRFSAGPRTRGSVRWLQARADQVRPRDPEFAAILDDRAKIRESRLRTLRLRQRQLPKVKQWCASHGLGSGG